MNKEVRGPRPLNPETENPDSPIADIRRVGVLDEFPSLAMPVAKHFAAGKTDYEWVYVEVIGGAQDGMRKWVPVSSLKEKLASTRADKTQPG